MTKRWKRIASNVICFLMMATLVGCKNPADSSDEPQSGNKEPVFEAVEGKYIVNDGKTEYKILLPQQASNIESYAAMEFQNFFYEATGITIDVLNESGETVQGKYIALGDTSLSSGSEFAFTGEWNEQAFKIRTVNDSIVIAGNNDYGTLWGVYETLDLLFDYEYYAADTYEINKNVVELPLYELTIDDQPDFETRTAYSSQSFNDLSVARRMRLQQRQEIFISNVFGHSSFRYFNGVINSEHQATNIDERYLATTKKQLCYTAHGDEQAYNEMLNISLEALLRFIEEDTESDNKVDIMYGIQDFANNWCECEPCKQAKQTYGTNAGAMIIYLNKLHRMLNSYFEENNIKKTVNIIFFAYNDTQAAPVKKGANGNWEPFVPEVKCDAGVYAMLAPIYTNWLRAYEDEGNETALEQLKQWRALSDELYLWTYNTNFSHYMYAYDAFSNIQRNYQLYKDLNVRYLQDQGRKDCVVSTCFYTFREYLSSKLLWDTDENVAELTEDFFHAYFGEAYQPMMNLYNELRILLNYNVYQGGMPSNVYHDITLEKFWPEATIIKWLEYIDQAYESIEPLKTQNPEMYSKLWDHITIESVFVRYAYIEHYVMQDSTEEETLQKELLADCLKVGVSKFNEQKAITEMFK